MPADPRCDRHGPAHSGDPSLRTVWVHVPVETPDGISQGHVVPSGDLRMHIAGPGCWCHPVEDEEAPDLWNHNALDQRERYEAGAPLH